MDNKTNIFKHQNSYKHRKKEVKMGIWDALAKIALIIVILYLLAKALGVVSSPWQLDVLAIVSGGYFIWRYATKLDHINEDIKELKDVCLNIRKRK